MGTRERIDFLVDLIRIQKWTLNFNLFLAFTILILGLIIIFSASSISSILKLEDSDAIVKIGGTFFVTLTSWPGKNLFAIWGKLKALEYLRKRYENRNKKDDPPPPDEELDDGFKMLIEVYMGA